MARVFIADSRRFPDPDPSLAVDQVRRLLADFMPELANARVIERQEDEDTIYEFQKTVGTKGSLSPHEVKL